MKWFNKIMAWFRPKKVEVIYQAEEKNSSALNLNIKRVAIVVGHNSRKQGAVTSFVSNRFGKKVSEFVFNKEVSNNIAKFAYEVETFIFERNPNLSYEDQCKDIAKRIFDARCDAAILLHCNAGGGSGFEVLIADDSILDSLDIQLAKAFVDAFNAAGDQKMRQLDGIPGVKKCHDGHSGFNMMHCINKYAKVPVVLLERCFFDDASLEVKNIVNNPMAYAKLIGKTVKKFGP